MKHRPETTHGFALVIALSLMAFILLLILSITTLVRVETQSANVQLAQLKARMNAQLGAMVALGDLQRFTGPDQRVTARSDILLAPGSVVLPGSKDGLACGLLKRLLMIRLIKKTGWIIAKQDGL